MRHSNHLTRIALIVCLALNLQTPLALAQSGEKDLYLVAQKAFEDGFYDVAIRYIKQILEQYPQTDKRIQLNLLLGQCYFFQNQYLKAYEIFQSLLSNAEYKDATLFWLGETYLKGSDYKQAEKYYRELMEAFPKSEYTPQAYYSLGWVYFDQNNFKKAKEAFQQLLIHYPAHQLSEDAAFKLAECFYNLRDYENTVKSLTDYVLTYPQSQRHAEAYFYIAESYYYRNDPLNAASYYAKTTDIAYDNKLILMAKVSLGWCYLKLGKHSLSQQYFDEALAFAKSKNILSDDIYLGQATLFAEMGEHPKALEVYEHLITEFPNSKRIIEAYLGKANTHYLLGDYKQAIAAYQALIDQFAANPQLSETIEKAYFGLAWSYLKAGTIDSSIQTFEKIKDSTENKIVKISALTQIGDAYQDLGEFQKAVDIYDQILSAYPDSMYADYVQFRQGIALLRMDKVDAATISFQSLQANFPKSKYLNDAKYYLAVSYFTKGDWATAREQIDIFTQNAPDRSEFIPEALYIRALSNFNLYKYAEALQTFEQIIKNYPDQSDIVRNSEVNIAKCMYKLGNIKEALKRFKILVYKYPESEIAQESLIWLGDHYLEVSEFDQAINFYQEFIEKFPGSEHIDSVYYELGQAYVAKNEFDQALSAFKSIDQAKHRDIYAKAKLTIAEIFAKELDTEAAIATYENIIATSPEFKRDAYLKIAEYHKEEKKFEKAIGAYNEALKADGGLSQIKNAEIQFYIADTYESLSESKQAVDEYFKIPYLYQDEKQWITKAYLRIARIFEDNENWQEAITVYNKVIDLQGEESKFAQERLEWIAEYINTH